MNDQLARLLEENDRWLGLEGEHDDLPFLLRVRPQLQPFLDTGDYPHHLTVRWPYDSDNNEGMPSDETLELLEEVEDTLQEAFEHDLQCILAFVYTGHHHHEWHFYTRDVAETGERLNEALGEFDELPLELSAEEDPEWSDYKGVMEGASDEETEA